MNRSEWMLVGSNGEAEAEPHDFLESVDGKPEAYRYVLRQSRVIVARLTVVCCGKAANICSAALLVL
jgi:hypothetical protein